MASCREIDCLRYDAAADRSLDRLCFDDLLDRRLEASGLEHLAPQGLGRIGDGGVLVEQCEQGGLADRGGRQDGGDAVEALELGVAGRLGDRLIGLDGGALLAYQESDDLELRPGRRLDLTALDRGLDITDRHRQLGDDVLIGAGTGSSIACRCTTSTRLALSSSSH